MAITSKYSRKAIVGFCVIGAHVLLAFGLVVATVVKEIPQIKEALEAKLLKQEEQEKPKEPPPPPPDFKPPPVQTPVLDVPIVTGPPPPTAIVAKHEEAKPAPKAPPAPPPIAPARLAKGLNLGDVCESYYPPASRRLNEEGSVVIVFKVLVNGHVGETKIETSSGFPRLDEATAKCLTSQGRFEPERQGSEVHETWQRLKYTWRLKS